MEYLSKAESAFLEWLKANPQAHSAPYADIAALSGKSERRVRELIEALQVKGYINAHMVRLAYLMITVNE